MVKSTFLEEDEVEGLKKQRHTARRIFDRLVEEKGFEFSLILLMRFRSIGVKLQSILMAKKLS